MRCQWHRHAPGFVPQSETVGVNPRTFSRVGIKSRVVFRERLEAMDGRASDSAKRPARPQRRLADVGANIEYDPFFSVSSVLREDIEDSSAQSVGVPS